MRHRTGLDPQVSDHVLSTPGARELIKLTVDRIRAWLITDSTQIPQQKQDRPLQMHIACRGGRHRSVAMAEEAARQLRHEGIGVEVHHRDIDKPLIGN